MSVFMGTGWETLGLSSGPWCPAWLPFLCLPASSQKPLGAGIASAAELGAVCVISQLFLSTLGGKVNLWQTHRKYWSVGRARE